MDIIKDNPDDLAESYFEKISQRMHTVSLFNFLLS